MAQYLSNLPIGAKVKFGKHSINGETAQDIIWLVVAKNHSGYPSNSVTLQAASIIDLRSFDDPEPSNSADRNTQGNNRYSVSNIDQWLNANGSGGSWYFAKHSADAAPTNNDTKYADRPGFLYHLTDEERAAILSTTIRVVKPSVDGGGFEDIARAIFLPSVTEIGLSNENNTAEGSVWEYYSTNGAARRISSITTQVYNYSKSSNKPVVGNAWAWWTRTPSFDSDYSVRQVAQYGQATFEPAYIWLRGIRPALNLASTRSVSDTTDRDGCYTLNWNAAPPIPTTLTVPTVYGGKSTAISWSKVTDPDGQAVTYQLESSVNGGAYTILYTGVNLSFTTIIPFGSTTVQFRVKAIDSMGASSSYLTSTNRTVINNNAPIISDADGDLGVQEKGFSKTYTVNDTNNNPVTVTEAIDGVQVRSYEVTLGATNTFSVEDNTWVALANGNHTITITATDGMDSSVRTYRFVKSVSSFTIQNSAPMVASTRPTRIKVTVSKTIPAEATMKIEVCNNGFASDENKVWEDATKDLAAGFNYQFTNTDLKGSTQWGVLIRVTVNRNTGNGACYITSIGGNFE